jgi:type I site-specific deoxyribonuclease, hsdR family
MLIYKVLKRGNMSDKYNEHELEESIIQMFQEKGYERIKSDSKWLTERKLDEYLIEDDIYMALHKINPQINRSLLDEVVKMIKHLHGLKLIERNKLFHKYLIDGLIVQDNHSNVNPLVRIIDFENINNNSFKIVSQVKFNEGRATRIPDIIIYINGIPLIIFELKSIENREDSTIENAYEQLGGNSENSGYRYDIPTIFNYNAFCVISDGINNRLGTITSTFERYSEWKSVDGENVYGIHSVNKLDVIIDGVFEKERLLDIIMNNIFYIIKDKEHPIKILSQYHQYFGIKKAFKSILKNKKPEGTGRAGIIWHTQGSGKSFSMLMLTYRLIKEKSLNNPTIVILTDRNDLDDQLYTTFSSASEYLRITPVKVESRKDLIDTLSKIKESGIIFTTIQKIDKDNIIPNKRENIIVISDEAHRSHYGLEETVKYSNKNNKFEIKTVFGYEKYIRDAMPNATFIGFTGTPVQTKDKDTTAIFGDIIDTYDMTQSIEDGSTVKLFYESRLAKVWLDDRKLEEIDQYYSSMYKEGVTEDLINMSKSQMSRMELLIGDEDRLKLLAKDIIEHYENRKGILNDKAMIVCMSRKIAFDLYNIMLSLRPEYNEQLKLIVTSSNKDDEKMREVIKDKKYRDYIANDFKNKNGKTKIVIVVDMWLTGFDVPDLDVMYIDKPMKGHNLMQAIARVNRIYAGKSSGLIVDYIGIFKSINNALSIYTKRDKETNMKDIRNAAKTLIYDNLSILNELFYNVDKSKFNSNIELEKFRAIQEGTDFVLKDEKLTKDFMEVTRIIKNAYVIVLGILDINKKVEINYYLAIRHFIQKLEYSKSPYSLTKINERVSELLAEAIIGDEVKVLTKAENEEDSNIWDLLKEEKIKELRNSNKPHVFIKILEKLLSRAIKEYKKYNLIKSQEYSEKLRRLLQKYNSRTIYNEEDENLNVEQTIIGLIAFSGEMLEDEENARENNLNGRERAFYDALTTEKRTLELMEDETLRLIAVNLEDIVKEYATVDWSKKRSTRVEMRVRIKRLLNKYGYPPEYNEKAINDVISQAEYMM